MNLHVGADFPFSGRAVQPGNESAPFLKVTLPIFTLTFLGSDTPAEIVTLWPYLGTSDDVTAEIAVTTACGLS